MWWLLRKPGLCCPEFILGGEEWCASSMGWQAWPDSSKVLPLLIPASPLTAFNFLSRRNEQWGWRLELMQTIWCKYWGGTPHLLPLRNCPLLPCPLPLVLWALFRWYVYYRTPGVLQKSTLANSWVSVLQDFSRAFITQIGIGKLLRNSCSVQSCLTLKHTTSLTWEVSVDHILGRPI